MHEIQKILLKRLLTQNGQRYSTLTAGYSFEDNIVFHLKQLATNGLIKKEGGIYVITAEGVKAITQYDLNTIADTGFKTFFLGFVCGIDNCYLIKEHPTEQSNFYNLPGGKPRFGEPIDNALIRTFEENTGIVLKPDNFKYQSLHLKTVKTSDNEVLFDDAFAVYQVEITNSQKEMMKLSEHILWKNEDEIKMLPNRWPEIDICIIKKEANPYFNYEVISDYILY